MAHGREIKRRILDLLAGDDWEAGLPELADLGQQAAAPLFSALCSSSPQVRWHAVTALGVVVAAMAGRTPEKARVIMRRFIWSLNDESGGIGWGAPEAMAEIMTQSPLVAAEYHNHLLAYIHEDHCLFLSLGHYEALVGRLAQVRPDLAAKAEPDLLCALGDCDAAIRGLAAWACGLLSLTSALPQLRAMNADPSTLELYLDRRLLEPTVASLATEAIYRITGHAPALN